MSHFISESPSVESLAKLQERVPGLDKEGPAPQNNHSATVDTTNQAYRESDQRLLLTYSAWFIRASLVSAWSGEGIGCGARCERVVHAVRGASAPCVFLLLPEPLGVLAASEHVLGRVKCGFGCLGARQMVTVLAFVFTAAQRCTRGTAPRAPVK